MGCFLIILKNLHQIKTKIFSHFFSGQGQYRGLGHSAAERCHLEHELER